MPGGVTSKWKLTLDPDGTPIVLVAIGDKLEDEIDFGGSREAGVTPKVRSAAPHLHDGMNVVADIAFARYLDTATDAERRTAIMRDMLSALSLGKKPLKIEADGVWDKYWQFAEALVTTHRPRPYLSSPTSRRLTVYQITAISLSEVAVPAVLDSDDSYLTDSDDSILTDG